MLPMNLFIKLIFSSIRLIVWRQSIIIIQIIQSACEDANICLQTSFISVDFEVLKQDDTRYADGDQISSIIFGPVVLFSGAKLTTSSEKHLEKVDNLHTVSLLNELLTSGQQTSELLYVFEESQATRRIERTTNKTEKETFLVNIKLIDSFGFADQEKVTYGLGYTLT